MGLTPLPFINFIKKNFFLHDYVHYLRSDSAQGVVDNLDARLDFAVTTIVCIIQPEMIVINVIFIVISVSIIIIIMSIIIAIIEIDDLLVCSHLLTVVGLTQHTERKPPQELKNYVS